jgi:hypothetical protein
LENAQMQGIRLFSSRQAHLLRNEAYISVRRSDEG